MRSLIVPYYITKMQKTMFDRFHDFAQSHTILCKLGAIPVSILDVFLDTARTPLCALERLVFVVINVFGKIFSSRCTFKDAYKNLQGAFKGLLLTVIKVPIAPCKIFCQIYAIGDNPQQAQSISASKYKVLEIKTLFSPSD